MNLKRNSDLDANKLAEEFRRYGRVQIREFFEHESALFVESALRELPWELVYRDGNTVVRLSPEELRNLPAHRASEIRQIVDQGARQGFQFLYNSFPLLESYFQGSHRNFRIFSVYKFLNSQPTLDFLRDVTGLARVRWLDGQGALYQAGHFLKMHTDHSDNEPRLAAYVLSFARDWNADWGGLLQFLTDEDDIEFALRPRFNALNLFTVPRRHSVSVVSPWSPGLRFSVTGWMRGDNPPAPFD